VKTKYYCKGEGMNSNLIWLDLEMTGLNPERHVILEIAVLVSDEHLNILAEGPDIAIKHPDEALKEMDSWNREHHQASGLLDRVRASSHNTESAEKLVLDFVQQYAEPKQIPLCGNSIWQDRRFLSAHMPELEAYFHYRIVDVSSIKELVTRWYPSLPTFEKKECHRALSDIIESIEELKYYRDKVFVTI
jgi:oligoribonuclease